MNKNHIWPVKDRIVYVVNHSFPYSSNGYAVRTHIIAKGMQQNGCEVLVLTRPGYPYELDEVKICDAKFHEEVDGIRYFHLRTPQKSKLSHEKWLEESERSYFDFLSIFKPTLVVAASNWELAIPAQRAAKKLNLPFSYEVRGFWELSRASNSPEFLGTDEFNYLVEKESLAAKNADRVFTLNKLMKNELVSRGVNKEAIDLMPNGFEVPNTSSRNARVKIDSKSFSIGYIGSFARYEGLEVLVDAIAELQLLNKRVHLYLVGSSNPLGTENDQCEVTEELVAKACALGVSDLITFTGRLAPELVGEYYDKVDLIVIPRKKLIVSDLVSPIKPLEAAARAKPMLLSNIAPFEEYFNAGIAQKISSLSGPAIARDIVQLVDNESALASLGRKANEWLSAKRKPIDITSNLAEYVKSLPSGIESVKLQVKNSVELATENDKENSKTFNFFDITSNQKSISVDIKSNQIIKLSGKILLQSGEKKNVALVQVCIPNYEPTLEEAKKLSLSFSQKLGFFKYIPVNGSDWELQIQAPKDTEYIELTFRSWYPLHDVTISLLECHKIFSFEDFIVESIEKYGTELPDNVYMEISEVYGSEEIAKNLRRVFDLGHITLAQELLIYIKPEHKIKYSSNVNTVRGYVEIAKRFPTVCARRKRVLEDSNTVCMVAHTSLPYHSNGYATRTHEIAKQLSKSYELTVLTRPGYPNDLLNIEEPTNGQIIDNVNYKSVAGAHYYKDSLTDYIKSATRILLREFIELKPKFVHAASSIHNALPALLAARQLGVPFIYEVRGFWEVTRASVNPKWGESERYKIEHDQEVYIAKNADHVVALTGGIKQELIRNSVEEARITVVSNAISTDKFFIDEGEKTPSCDNSVVTIGYVGSVVEYEGLEDLVDALEIVAKEGHEFKFVIAGDGNKFDSFKAKVSQSTISDKIQILGRIPHEDVGDLLQQIDIMPLPRKPMPVCEMVSPLKPFESMISRKALVGSNVAAIAEIIRHNETGLLFQKGNIKDLAHQLIKLISNPKLRKELGNNAYEWVTKYKTWEKVSESYHNIYSSAQAHHAKNLTKEQRAVKILVYGNVDLNYIDGSSIWAASISDVLSTTEGVEVDILLKSDAYKSKVIKQLTGLNKPVRYISPTQFNKKQRLSPPEATQIIQSLQQNEDYDIVLVRGKEVYEGLAKLPEFDGLLWIYPIEILKKEASDLTEADLIPLKRARKLLCQSHAFENRLLEYGFEQENIVYVPPMVPNSPINLKDYADKGGVKKLVYAGKFDQQWGVLEMFETFEELYKSNKNIELHVYGEKIHNPEKSEEFEQRIKNYLKMPGVIWHKGVEREVVLRDLPLYDLAWAWRRPELDLDTHEISTKFLEYSSSTLPIVCLNGSMNKSLLGENYPLFIESQSLLASKVEEFLLDSDKLKRAAEICYQAVRPFFFTSVANKHFQPAIESVRPNREQTVLVAGHDLKFINSHISLFKQKGFKVLIDKWKGHVGNDELQSYAKLAGANVVISEWALGNSVWYTNRKLLEQTHMVRLHLQEESTEFPVDLNPENIDFFNYINHQVQRNVNERFFNGQNVGEFFPNYIHFDDFSLPKPTDSRFSLGFIGIVPQRKRFDLALDLLEKLRAKDKRYTLRVKGKLPEDFPWMLKRTEEMKYYDAQYKRIEESDLLKGGVIFDGHGNDMDHWFTKVGYILSTSDFEGSHQAVAEGMASGCIPLILPWEGADELYPKNYVFDSIDAMRDKVIESSISESETTEIKSHVKPWDIKELNTKLIKRLAMH